MNAERTLAVAKRLNEDLSRSNLPSLLSQLADALRNAAGNPAEATFQNQIADLRGQVAAAATGSDVETFSPVERQVLAEWGVDEVVGTALAERIEAIFRANTITLATAAEQIPPIASALSTLTEKLGTLISSLEFFGVTAEELAVGEFEIDVLIPRPAVEDALGSLGSEFRQLESILLPFIELTTGSRPPIKIRSIGSSDFTVFLHSLPVTAACVAAGIDKVIRTYQRVIEIRLAKAQIANLPLPDGEELKAKAAKPLEEYANTLVAAEVDKIASQLISKYKSQRVDDHRANELRISITHSLSAIADRIDNGFNIAVRAGPPPELPEEDEDEASAGGDNEVARITARYAAEVTERTSKLEFMVSIR